MNILKALWASLVLSSPVTAHHSFNAHYDAGKSVTIEGEVTEFKLVNPHSRFYVKVADDAGGEMVWLVEMGSRNGMLRDGWTADTIKPGDVVRVVGAPGRNTENIMHQETITTLDGTPVGPPRNR
jgi:DNA/RNA endonuclease YhcR with UshA esterase domain